VASWRSEPRDAAPRRGWARRDGNREAASGQICAAETFASLPSAAIRTIGSGSASALRAGLIFAGTRPSLITSAQAREALADHTSGVSSPIIVGNEFRHVHRALHYLPFRHSDRRGNR